MSSAQQIKHTAIALVGATVLLFLAVAGNASAAQLYVANQNPQSIGSFSMSPDGVLTAAAGSPFPTVTEKPRSLVTSADGKFLYAGHRDANKLSQYSTALDGTVTHIGTDFSYVSGTPQSGSILPNGTRLYYSTNTFGSPIRYYAIQGDGLLNPLGTAASPSNGGGLVITPDGRYMFGCESTQNIHRFSLDAAGTPTLLPVDSGGDCTENVVTPDGRFLVTVTSGGTVKSFAIGSDGSIAQVGSSVEVGNVVIDMEISPDGRSIYVLRSPAGGSAVHTVALSAEGTPSATGNVATISAAGVIGSGLAASPDGRHLVATIGTASSNIVVLRINGTALPVPVAGSPFSSGGDLTPNFPSNIVAFRTNLGPTIQSMTVTGKNRVRTLTAVSPSDADGSVASYFWEFGDGQSATTSQPTVKHTFAKNGTYAARVTVIDNEGCGAADIFNGRRFFCNSSGAAIAEAAVDAQPPTIGRPKLSRKSIKQRRSKTKLSLRLNESATLVVEFQRQRGRKFRKGAQRKIKLKSGKRSVTLTAKVGRKTLAKGKYRLKLIATDGANNASSAKYLKLRIR